MQDTVVPAENWTNPADLKVKFRHDLMVFDGSTEGEEVEAHYEFENIGGDTLEIEIVSVCNCMKVEWTRTPVSPGQYGTVDVVFDTAGLSGVVSKDIDVIFKNTDKDGYPLIKRVALKGKVFKRI